jgi:hypothetical protein
MIRTLSWTSRNSTSYYLRQILISFPHIRQGLASGIFLHVFHLRFCVPLLFPGCATWPHNILSSFERRFVRWMVQIVKYTIFFSLLFSVSLKQVFSSRYSILKHLQFWKSVWKVTPCSLLPFWMDTTGVSETLLPVHESARLHVPDVRNLYGDRCENSEFNSSGIHMARETKFSCLVQTNEPLLWRWSCTLFSYEYILRTRRFGDWLCLHPRVMVCSVEPII